ncbi:hypothetical protein XELAEV_18005457mg [Xenopus laevis]|uniref:exodeoxyribonuclease III n=1 Tax=Xenopus laevis TaxID=8355 RepID=A0A974DX23_XENLA|nr:hypothetical protein XELAEV_18005457mg [Xenopus laevis]
MCSIVSYNVNGLNEPVKRSQILNMCRKLQTHIILLQETHFKEGHTPRILDKNYTQVYYSNNPEKKATGVLIMIHKDLPLVIHERKIDREGRYIIIKGNLGASKLTIANVYAPNTAQVNFLKKFLEDLNNFKEGIVIMGGDLNLVFNPSMDSSNGKSHISHKGIKSLKKKLEEIGLVDTWRVQHPKDKDYTHFSKKYSVYTRIDYLFVSQGGLHWVKEAKIITNLFSDHYPILLKLNIPQINDKDYIWRFNDLLLHNKDTKDKIRNMLQTILKENSGPEVGLATLWETKKCVLRGQLIALGSNLKKEKEKHINNLLKEISNLERIHKTKITEDILEQLEKKRIQLKAILDQGTYKAYMNSKQKGYELGDKCNKYFAQKLKKMNSTTHITAIKGKDQKTYYDTKSIVKIFQQYYQTLYRLQGGADHNDKSKGP